MCVLTGAGGQLGNAFCQKYLKDYDIVAVCRHRAPNVPSQYDSFVDPLDPTADVDGGRVFVVHTDLEKEGEPEHVVDLVLARHGRVDLLVNNAAFSVWHRNGMIDGDAALNDAARHFAVNVELPMRLGVRLAQKFWSSRAAENRAANRNVVNVSSLAGTGIYGGGQAVYAASKAAQNQMTRHMAREFDGFGVRVNGLAPNSFPGIVSTESVADAVVRLDRESVTGKILVVDKQTGNTATS
ncbi:SDR family oxidoreductase [Nocardioides sp. Root151]|uniref:SDR family oxidoreductase n=1 Tax=Nocardioides sp. Root151 TaxID=1736475 RepID=UPI000703BEBB|nr:SDR family oxidoreductase [Nocardioides sp. Root151]KQZ75119.1 short-chain dehydrogenase [Nocardioides sp. Root151]